MYRTRSSWFVLEALLGYIAIASGISGVANKDGQLFWTLYGLGENYAWGVTFCGIGSFLLISAIIDRAKRLMNLEAKFRMLAMIRKWAHFGLVVCWSYAVIVFEYDEIPLPVVVLLAPALVIVHVRGAWEHVKVSRCIRVPEHRTVYGAIATYFRRIRGARHPDGRRKSDSV